MCIELTPMNNATHGTQRLSFHFFSATNELGIPIPEMIFGNNFLCIEHKSGFKLEFKALPALAMVDQSSKSSDLIKVSYAREWFEKRRYSALALQSALLLPFCHAFLVMLTT